MRIPDGSFYYKEFITVRMIKNHSPNLQMKLWSEIIYATPSF